MNLNNKNKVCIVLFICCLSFFIATKVFAVVNITPASGGENINVNNASNSPNPAYTTLGDIIIASQDEKDFKKKESNATLILTAPSGWVFNPGVGSGSVSGEEITFNSIEVTSSSIIFTYTTSKKKSSNATITISGVGVMAVDGSVIPNAGNILRTSANPGTGTIDGIVEDETNFGSLSQSAVSTQSPTSATSGGPIKPAKVSFSGLAFPMADISVSLINGNEILNGNPINALADGTFNVSYEGDGLSASDNSFALTVYDNNKNIIQTKLFTLKWSELSVESLLMSPTLNISKQKTQLGSFINITGLAMPNYKIELMVDGVSIPETVIADNLGNYKFTINTYQFGLGQHSLRVRQIDSSEKASDYSIEKNFTLTTNFVSSADLNADGNVDIKDLSIFLSYYMSSDSEIHMTLDINEDGEVNIKDFGFLLGSM